MGVTSVDIADGRGDAKVHLFVSNQSFVDDPVQLEVTIDGVTVAADRFRVERQHTWVQYEVSLTSGTREVSATSGTGASQQASLTVPPRGERWVVISYWNDSESERSISIEVHDRPVGFM
jgi:uncharacterized protein YfaP (DUF2135 family)